MPATPAQFKTEFKEFRLLEDAVVQAKLDQAYLRVGTSWGDLQDAGVKLLTAHLLSISPLAEPSRKSVKAGSRTSYLDEYDRLLAQVRVFATAASADDALTVAD